MRNEKIKNIVLVGILIIFLLMALSILKWLIWFLLPLAVVIIAAYLVYGLIKRK